MREVTPEDKERTIASACRVIEKAFAPVWAAAKPLPTEPQHSAPVALETPIVKANPPSRRIKKSNSPVIAETLLHHWPTSKQTEHLTMLLAWRYGKQSGSDLAVRLMKEFGSLPAVLSASTYRLSRVAGVGPSTVECLQAFREIAERMAMERIALDKPLLSEWSSLIDYLHVATAYEQNEQLRILYLDKRNRLIAEDVQRTGTVDHVPCYPREVIRRCLELGAAAIVLAHNHPSGDPSPSSADVNLTKDLTNIGKPLGIVVHDHIVMGRTGNASIRQLGLL